jgi:hypothetical protein
MHSTWKTISTFLTGGGLILAAACNTEPTAPSASNLRPHQDLVALSSSYIIDTGAGTGGTSTIGTLGLQNTSGGTIWQFLGGQFTLANEAHVESVEGWMKAGSGTINVHIRNDAAGLPGTDVITQAYSVTADAAFAWKAFSLTVTLPAGTYWLTFEPSVDFVGNMSGSAPNPLARYAFNANPVAGWHAMSTALGMRVFGSINSASGLIATLRAYVAGAGLPKPLPTKIDGSLQKALDALGASNTAGACINLQDVIDLVNKQSVKKVPASVSSEIISETNAIRTAVGC